MRMPKRGEKGFTLIELLIVVAILGVLAAVVIPNVGRFIGAGEEEAAATEFSNVQTAVIAMMTDNELSELPAGTFPDNAAAAVNTMGAFPSNAACVTVKVTDPDGVAYDATDQDGYYLYQHDIHGGDGVPPDVGAAALVNYLATATTKGTYYIDASGTVVQATHGYE